MLTHKVLPKLHLFTLAPIVAIRTLWFTVSLVPPVRLVLPAYVMPAVDTAAIIPLVHLATSATGAITGIVGVRQADEL